MSRVPLRVHVASPCDMNWATMKGDDRKRFCSSCELNVYNLSDLSHDEARALIEQAEGRLCVRFYQRSDGTVLTKDCPVGKSALMQRITKMCAAGAFTLLMGLGSIWTAFAPQKSADGPGVVESLRGVPGIGGIVDRLYPRQVVGAMIGKVAPSSAPGHPPAP